MNFQSSREVVLSIIGRVRGRKIMWRGTLGAPKSVNHPIMEGFELNLKAKAAKVIPKHI